MTEPKSRRLRWLILVGILIVLAAAGTVIFRGIGEWLIVQDPLDHADAIVILTGHLPDRALEAARLYHNGNAEQVWISQPDSPAEELKKMNISFLGEDFYNERVLLAQGVPITSILILQNPVANTEEELGEISATLRRNNAHTAILVTSKPHTRRVRTIWHRIAGPDLRLIVRYASDDPYDAAHWWRHTRDGLDVTREVLGLFNAWAGFPLRPSRY